MACCQTAPSHYLNQCFIAVLVCEEEFLHDISGEERSTLVKTETSPAEGEVKEEGQQESDGEYYPDDVTEVAFVNKPKAATAQPKEYSPGGTELTHWDQGPISRKIFPSLLKIQWKMNFVLIPILTKQLPAKFCRCHDNSACVAFAKFVMICHGQ